MKNHLQNKYCILHITPHLGGGVGKVLLNYLMKVKKNDYFLHKVITLEYANEKAILILKSIDIELVEKMASNHEGIINAINKADIILVHWWNHPLLYAFLVQECLPPCRVIFWSHIAGFNPPYVFTYPALEYPDLFVFTSPMSMESPEVKRLSQTKQNHLRVIWSTGGIEHVSSILPQKHIGFNVGYIGTVDYSKMNPHFLELCAKISIPEVHFIVCGGSAEKQIQQESMKYGDGKCFTFTGQINDISKYLSLFDVFGYPLAPYHYGTCEQSLCESMAAGVPPVVLANKTESYIVDDGVTGIVAENNKAYVQAIEFLNQNSSVRLKLARNAKEIAKQKFSIDQMVKNWEKAFEYVLSLPKTVKQWQGNYRGRQTSGCHFFVESLGEYGKDFACHLTLTNKDAEHDVNNKIKHLLTSSPAWQSKTHGTTLHYKSFFPNDRYLNLWSDLI